MATPFWGTNPKAWDAPTIAGAQIPGVVRLASPVGRRLKIDDGQAAGNDGGSVTIKGLENPRFHFLVELRTDAEQAAWDQLVALLEPRQNPRDRKPVPVYHPSLARYGIQVCLVEYIGDEEQPTAGGNLRGKIECRGLFPSKKGATKKAAANGAAGPAPTIPLAVTTGAKVADIRGLVSKPTTKFTSK